LSSEHEEPYIYHFPDGNASIARLLVRRLIPGIAPGSTMEDIVLARFDYGQIDRAEHPVRIRLNSTVVDVRNVDRGVEIAYVSGGKISRVAATDCVLACYHAMIPYIASETDAEQRAALHDNVRAPLVYVNVVVRNWHPWHKLGVAAIDNPGGTYAASLDFPVSLDGYKFSADPSAGVPALGAHPCAPNQGLNMREQYRAGRTRLYTMNSATSSAEIRDRTRPHAGLRRFRFPTAMWRRSRSIGGRTAMPTRQPAVRRPAHQPIAVGAPAARPHRHRHLDPVGCVYPRGHRSGAPRSRRIDGVGARRFRKFRFSACESPRSRVALADHGALIDEIIQLRDQIGLQFHHRSAEILFQVRRAGGAGNGHQVLAARQHPGQRQLRHGRVRCAREPRIFIEQLQIRGVRRRRESRHRAAQILGVQRGDLTQGTGEKPRASGLKARSR
jgi:hypothetical protein